MRLSFFSLLAAFVAVTRAAHAINLRATTTEPHHWLQTIGDNDKPRCVQKLAKDADTGEYTLKLGKCDVNNAKVRAFFCPLRTS